MDASQIMNELDNIVQVRTNRKLYAQRNAYRFDVARQHIELSVNNLGSVPIGAGMSARAVEAAMGTQTEIKNTLRATGADPALTSIAAAQSAFQEI